MTTRDQHYKVFDEHVLEEISKATGYSLHTLVGVKLGTKEAPLKMRKAIAGLLGYKSEVEAFERLEAKENEF